MYAFDHGSAVQQLHVCLSRLAITSPKLLAAQLAITLPKLLAAQLALASAPSKLKDFADSNPFVE